MRVEQDKYELIEQYLKGLLSQEDKLLFEENLTKNADLRNELLKHKKVFELITDNGLLKIKNDIYQIHIRKTRINTLLKGIGALTLVLIASITIYTLKSPKKAVTHGSPVEIIQKDQISNKNTLPKNNSVTHKTDINTNKQQSILQNSVNKDDKKVKQQEANTNSATKEIVIKSAIDSNTIFDSKIIDNYNTPERSQEKPFINEGIKTDSLNIKSPCTNVELYSKIKTTESCNNKPTGAIIFDLKSITGGAPPYNFSIDNGKHYYTTHQFPSLKAGLYFLHLKDKSNCTTSLGAYRVEMKDCTYEEAFAPSKGETWKVPTEDKTCVLTIYFKQGNIAFSKQIEHFETYHWDGVNMNNNVLPMGLYRFLIQFNDNTEKTGYITIVR